MELALLAEATDLVAGVPVKLGGGRFKPPPYGGRWELIVPDDDADLVPTFPPPP